MSAGDDLSPEEQAIRRASLNEKLELGAEVGADQQLAIQRQLTSVLEALRSGQRSPEAAKAAASGAAFIAAQRAPVVDQMRLGADLIVSATSGPGRNAALLHGQAAMLRALSISVETMALMIEIEDEARSRGLLD